LVRLSGAQNTVGYDFPGFGRLFSATVSPHNLGPHEVDMRVALTRPVPNAQAHRSTHIAPPMRAQDPNVQAFVEQAGTFALLNIGARLQDKRLSAQTYASLATKACNHAQRVVLTYGPKERELADEVQKR